MGTPDFAVPTLDALCNSEYEVIGVVTQPDKPKGRGKSVQMTPVKECALKYDIPVYQPVKLREQENIDELSKLDIDFIVVVAFGQILPKAVLDMPKYGCINVHSSLLPKYRGAAPIQWTIIKGEEKTGITTMFMDEGLDTGDILLQEETPISDDETGGSLHDRLADMGASLLLKTLEGVKNNAIERVKQDNSLSNYVGMLNKSHGQMDFEKSAIELDRLVRGLNPWPSAYTSLNGKMFKIWEAKAIEIKEEYTDKENGEIVEVNKDSIIVKTGNGLLKLLQVQLEGKGFGFVEILSSCPTNWKMAPEEAHERIRTEMMNVYPLGVFKDVLENSK
jgi:methionyl-tRNA formyltransferase